MPNWCSNSLILSHIDPNMIVRVKEAAEKSKLFEEFVPVPVELNETVNGSFSDPEVQNKQKELEKLNEEKYGYPSWYEFCIARWGSKWDASDIEILSVTENTIKLSFFTAWSPPIEFYSELVESGFDVEAKFFEPGCTFVGTYDNEYGESTYDYSNCHSSNVRDYIGDELDDYFGISEMLEECEDDEY